MSSERPWVRWILVAGVLLFATGAHVYLTEGEALRIAFPEATRLEERVFQIEGELREELAQALGYAPRERTVLFYEAKKGDALLGHLVIMNEIGKRLPITFLVSILPDGRVDQVLLLVFREPRGFEVRARAFRRQYRGKRLGDPIRRGRDIRNISGATMSVDALNRGVRRALVFYDRLLRASGPAPIATGPDEK